MGKDDCICGFNQPEALPDGELLWPMYDEQQPEVVHTVEAFLEAMLFEPHVDRVVVLPNGVRLLQQQDGLPTALTQAARSSQTLRGFLDNLGTEAIDKFRGRLWHYSNRGSEKEIKRDKKKCFSDTVSELRTQEQSGTVSSNAPLYVSEMRWREKVKHPIEKEELVKTATNIDVYDFTPLARWMPLWERSEGGIFVGERGAGSGMHVDQCLWSNVGRNWCGFKLFALWPWEERHAILDDAGKGSVFHLPLTEKEVGYLRRAKTIALLRPGDAWVFSGGQPHTALCVGDGLNISAYESFVPAHPEAVGVLVRSNTGNAHWKNCWMDDDDLDELYEDVVDRLQHSLRDPSVDPRLRSRLQECVKVMREYGDSYCRELWEKEDRGERRRRREEEEEEDRKEKEEKDKEKGKGKELEQVKAGQGSGDRDPAEGVEGSPEAKKARCGTTTACGTDATRGDHAVCKEGSEPICC